MRIDDDSWKEIREFFPKALATTWHYAVATVSKDGVPHVTPIGALFLLDGGKGYYLERFPKKMAENLKHNKRICVMAVHKGSWAWLRSLIKGKAVSTMGIRLIGTAGEKRKATEQEREAWQKTVRLLKWTRGYDVLWKGLTHLRELEFDSYEPIRAGAYTADLSL